MDESIFLGSLEKQEVLDKGALWPLPFAFWNPTPALFGWAGEGLLSSQHSSLILLSLLDTWVNELWERIVSISFYLSARGSQVIDASGQFLQLSIHLAISPTGPARKKETMVINHYHCHVQSSTLTSAKQ